MPGTNGLNQLFCCALSALHFTRLFCNFTLTDKKELELNTACEQKLPKDAVAGGKGR